MDEWMLVNWAGTVLNTVSKTEIQYWQNYWKFYIWSVILDLWFPICQWDVYDNSQKDQNRKYQFKKEAPGLNLLWLLSIWVDVLKGRALGEPLTVPTFWNRIGERSHQKMQSQALCVHSCISAPGQWFSRRKQLPLIWTEQHEAIASSFVKERKTYTQHVNL